MFNNHLANSEPNLFGGGGGASQFGAGGGFVPSQAADPNSGAKKFHTQTLRAVTVRQIKEAIANVPDDNITIDGQDLNNITLVGKIVRLHENETNYDMLLHDGTGTLEVKLYVDNDDESSNSKKKECEPGHYVRVHGHIRPMENKHPLIAFNIRQILDFNEVTYHFLSCIYQHVHWTKGSGGPAQAPPTSAVKAMGGPQKGAGHEGNNVLEAVKHTFASANSELSIAQVVQGLQNRFSYQQVHDAAEALTGEGVIFTMTDDVYKYCG